MRVQKIASVARIYISESEITTVQKKLEDVYSWIEEIKHIDVSGYEPMYSVNQSEYRTVREVENPEFHSPSVVLANTPKKNDDFILVPKVIE